MVFVWSMMVDETDAFMSTRPPIVSLLSRGFLGVSSSARLRVADVGHLTNNVAGRHSECNQSASSAGRSTVRIEYIFVFCHVSRRRTRDVARRRRRRLHPLPHQHPSMPCRPSLEGFTEWAS
jgi:hypothetical protein